MHTNDFDSIPTPRRHRPRRPRSSRSPLVVVVGALLVALVLAACGQTEREAELGATSSEFDFDTALNLSSILNPAAPPALFYDPSQGNCVSHEFGMPGQGFHNSGSGGLNPEPPTPPIAPRDLPTALASDGGPLGSALLIVDDFGGHGYQLHESVFFAEHSEQLDFEGLYLNGGFSHGALVMHHANATIAASGLYRGASADADQVTWIHQGTGASLVVRAADIPGFRSNDVEGAIWDGLTALRQEGIDRTVINMSFTLIPCSITQDFLAHLHLYPEWDDYLNAIVQGGGQAALDELYGGIAGATESDPLRNLFTNNDFLGGGERILVAAAGNFGRDYAMYPAAWEEVLSVSASEASGGGYHNGPSTEPVRKTKGSGSASGTDRASFSNAGEVLETGAWFRIQGLGLFVGPSTESRLAYAGTSYASPAVAAISAIDLAGAQPRCYTGDDRSYLTSETHADVPLQDAIHQSCLR